MVEEGTRWWSGDGKTFVVLHVIEKEGHTWIHYRTDSDDKNKEYSCYEESFLSRFSPLPK